MPTPFIKHRLLDICLNCVSKWRARCLPSLLGYVGQKGELPPHLNFSIAAMMSLYRGGTLEGGKLTCHRGEETYTLQDDAAVLAFFAETGDIAPADQVKAFLSNEAFFGQNLTQVPRLADTVTDMYADILDKGMKAVVEERFFPG